MSRINLENSKLYDCIICMGWKMQTLNQVLTGALTIDRDSPPILNLDASGSTRVITFPAVEEGLTFLVNNISSTAVDLTINNPAAATIGTVSQNEAGLVFCAGGVWYHRLLGTST